MYSPLNLFGYWTLNKHYYLGTLLLLFIDDLLHEMNEVVATSQKIFENKFVSQIIL